MKKLEKIGMSLDKEKLASKELRKKLDQSD